MENSKLGNQRIGTSSRPLNKNSEPLIDKVIWSLTVILFASFYFSSLNEYGSYILFGITAAALLFIALKHNGKIRLSFERFHNQVAIFAIYSLLSSVWAVNRGDAIEKGITIIEILICTSVFYVFYSEKLDVEKLIKAVMTAGFIVSIYNLYTVGFSNVMKIINNATQLTDTFDNRNSIAMLAAISIVFSFYFISKDGFRVWNILDVIALLNVAAAGSKKGIIILILGTAVFYIERSLETKKMSTVLKILIGLVILYYVFKLLANLSVFSGVLKRFDTMFDTLLGNNSANYSTHIRLEYIKKGWELFKSKPIFGYGMGNAHIFAYRYFGTDNYLHNNYIELLVNGGLLGTIIYYSLFFQPLRSLSKSRAFRNDKRAIVVTLLVILLFIDFASVTYYSKNTYFYFLIAYLYVKEVAKEVERKRAESELQ